MNFAIQVAFVVLCTVSTCLCAYGPDYGYESVPGKRPEGSPALPGRVVQAALHTKHTIRFVNVDIPTEDREPQIIEVGAAPLPIVMHFKSASSRIRVQQSHSGSGPSHVQETKSEDSPTHLRHEVTKPIIQEVREIITPYRRVIQEIRPVSEEIQTVIAKKSDLESDKEPGSGGITGSVSNGGLPSYSGIKGVSSGNVKRSTRWSTNYGRY